MMQRLCSKLRNFSLCTNQSHRLLHFSTPQLHAPPRACISIRSNFPSSASFSPLQNNGSMYGQSQISLSLVQMRCFSAKEKKLNRRPRTPITSKLKKYKMKPYSSFKSRFKLLNDGTIRRWRAGKRHNAHLKSKKSKRRLRQPELVHPAYATVMKKLNFCG